MRILLRGVKNQDQLIICDSHTRNCGPVKAAKIDTVLTCTLDVNARI